MLRQGIQSSSPVAVLPPLELCWVVSMGFSRQEYWSGFAIMEAPLSPAAAWASGEWRNDRHSYCGGRYLDMISAYAGSTTPTHLVVGLTSKLNKLD